MKTRTASLQVAHQGEATKPKKRDACPSYGRSGLDSLEGCTCRPAFFTYYRASDGKIVRGDRTRNRRTADRMLETLQRELEGGNSPQRPKRTTFPAWVEEYQAWLEDRAGRGKIKARTVRDYTETLTRAVDAIGHCDLREIGHAELRRFVEAYGDDERAVSEATLGRALRELSACLARAVRTEPPRLDRNPVPGFREELELDTGERGKDPFTDAELPKLWAALATRDEHGQPVKGGADHVYLSLFRIATATGARLGELLALDWDDVSLSEKKLEIRHTFNPIDGLTAPKTKGSVRTIYLTPAALAELETVAAELSTGPVFVGPRGERLNGGYIARVLDRARIAAGIPKEGEDGLPRSFHSFRSTCDRRMLERGVDPEFVRAQLGHKSLELTLNHYGRLGDAARLAEAEKLTGDL